MNVVLKFGNIHIIQLFAHYMVVGSKDACSVKM